MKNIRLLVNITSVCISISYSHINASLDIYIFFLCIVCRYLFYMNNYIYEPIYLNTLMFALKLFWILPNISSNILSTYCINYNILTYHRYIIWLLFTTQIDRIFLKVEKHYHIPNWELLTNNCVFVQNGEQRSGCQPTLHAVGVQSVFLPTHTGNRIMVHILPNVTQAALRPRQ